MSSYPVSSSVAPPVSNDRLDSCLMGGMAPRGPGPRPSVRQQVCRAGSTPTQPASLPAPCSVGPVPQSGVQPLDDPSVFNVLNIFRACWFLNREHLLSLVLSAVKGGANNEVTWVDLLPQAHSHLLHQAKNLAPLSYPSALLKRVMFAYLLEIVNNSWPLSVDKFVKASAPRWHPVLPPAPSSSPPIPNPASAKVSTMALTQGSKVLPVETPLGDTDTQAPVAMDEAPDTSLDPGLYHLFKTDYLTGIAMSELMHCGSLDFMCAFGALQAIKSGIPESTALQLFPGPSQAPPTPASPPTLAGEKRPLSLSPPHIPSAMYWHYIWQHSCRLVRMDSQ